MSKLIPELKNDNVDFVGATPQLVYAIFIARDLAEKYDWPFFVITSLNDSKHSRTSLHFAGCGFDIRIRNPITGVKVNRTEQYVNELNDLLGIHFDIILERDHVHGEWQRKYRA